MKKYVIGINRDKLIEMAQEEFVPKYFSRVEADPDNDFYINCYEGDFLRAKIPYMCGNYSGVGQTCIKWFFDDGSVQEMLYSTSSGYGPSVAFCAKNGIVIGVGSTAGSENFYFPILLFKSQSGKTGLLFPCTNDNGARNVAYNPTSTEQAGYMCSYSNIKKEKFVYAFKTADKNTEYSVLYPAVASGEAIDGVYLPFFRQFTTTSDAYISTKLNGKKYFYTPSFVIEDE